MGESCMELRIKQRFQIWVAGSSVPNIYFPLFFSPNICRKNISREDSTIPYDTNCLGILRDISRLFRTLENTRNKVNGGGVRQYSYVFLDWINSWQSLFIATSKLEYCVNRQWNLQTSEHSWYCECMYTKSSVNAAYAWWCCECAAGLGDRDNKICIYLSMQKYFTIRQSTTKSLHVIFWTPFNGRILFPRSGNVSCPLLRKELSEIM